MSRYTGPKNKLARKLGVDLDLKSRSGSMKLSRRINIPPGQHGPKGRKRQTEYAQQLIEKQKLKYSYGVTEKQMKKYLDRAMLHKGRTGEMLLEELERRLDNIVFRLGFVPTRASARQLVSHGHIIVNGRKVDIPSFQVDTNDIISLAEKSVSMPLVVETLKSENKNLPSWLSREAIVGKVTGKIEIAELENKANLQLVVEYYSR